VLDSVTWTTGQGHPGQGHRATLSSEGQLVAQRAMTSSCLTPTACWMLRGCGLAATVGAEPSLVDTRPAACYPVADWLLSLLSSFGLASQPVIRPVIGCSACYPAGDWLFSLLSGRGLAAGAATEPSLVAARRPWQIKTARVCLVVPCAALT